MSEASNQKTFHVPFSCPGRTTFTLSFAEVNHPSAFLFGKNVTLFVKRPLPISCFLLEATPRPSKPLPK